MRVISILCIYAVLGMSCNAGGGESEPTAPTPPVEAPAPPAVERPVFDGERAFADLVAQCDFGPRVPGSEAHSQCRDFLLQRLTDSGAEVVTQQFTSRTGLSDREYEFTNLLGRFSPDADGPVLLLGAHWDSRAKADEDPDPALRDQPVLGANDGASGVAVLLELMRAFEQSLPDRPIIVAFFDAEDQGAPDSDLPNSGWIIGSQYLADNWPDELPWPEQMILVDMVGADGQHNPAVGTPPMATDEFLLKMERYSLQYAPNLVDEIWSIAEDLGHEAFVREAGRHVIDDHLPFLRRGVEAINIIHFVPAEWHTTHDTPEHCCPTSLHQVGDTLLKYIYRR